MVAQPRLGEIRMSLNADDATGINLCFEEGNGGQNSSYAFYHIFLTAEHAQETMSR